ncbi:hypothetical protein FE257_008470 [Aspergillus nanangensis]|uniref:Uncharacterized protein n=1 Tax=Aspergillus nanangensis TaxID=2582783 RepID=A0AAD4CLU8_ASPNN|nr:hypothetical protein FE257_008470 [Aspergillus nanangensis]
MLSSKRPFMADEELGKKDDDHKRRPEQHWHSRAQQWRPRRSRRLILGLLVLCFLYMFFKNMPTDLTPARERPEFAPTRQEAGAQWPRPIPPPDQGPPQRDQTGTDNNKDDYYYEGDLKFYSLGSTLKRFQRVGNRSMPPRHTVVFAGASLISISDLLPLACQMAGHKINEVHFILMGRDDVSIEGIQRVNGISDENCALNWHDGRTDYAQWSTELRMERAVALGAKFANAYLRPQVVITQGELLEEPFFLRGARRTMQEFGVSHIALPSAARNLMWMSALESNALQVWNDINIEFLIHAPPESSGSVIRLIRSLQEADYLGLAPSITVELPANVDPQLLQFLKTMNWPSSTSNKVTLRRRIQPQGMGSADASLKAVEAFYPRDPNVTHVLMLSPQVELAPSFYHYLIYTALKYKYSTRTKELSSRLLGISLELPSSHVTNDNTFSPPTASWRSNGNGEGILPSFLWQAPNSNAALYFGDKWVEFHSFLSRRFVTQEADPQHSSPENIVSKKYPAVMEYLLEFIRARGYYLLYPAFPGDTNSLATVHNELYHYPEEFSDTRTTNRPADVPDDLIDDASNPLTAENQGLGAVEKPLSRGSTVMPLLDQFPLGLAEIETLPVLSYQGEDLTSTMFTREMEEYVRQFKDRYGGCRSEELDANTDIFCIDT